MKYDFFRLKQNNENSFQNVDEITNRTSDGYIVYCLLCRTSQETIQKIVLQTFFSERHLTRTIRNTLYDEYITVNDILYSDRPTKRIFKLRLRALQQYTLDGRFPRRTDLNESCFIRSPEKTTETAWTIDGSLRSFVKSIIQRHKCVERSKRNERKKSERPCLL